MDHETEIELARHDERIKGLWRDIARSEAGQDKALGLASAELKAHLEILNNHQSDMREQQSTFSTKESSMLGCPPSNVRCGLPSGAAP